MKKEKFVLILVATIVGLLVAGIAFYLYQTTREIPNTKIKKIAVLEPTATPKPSIFADITSPSDESVSSNALITISGKTVPNAKFIITSPIDQSSGIASSQGDFSTTINLGSDQNVLKITVIAPNGETITKTVTVTYSTQDF